MHLKGTVLLSRKLKRKMLGYKSGPLLRPKGISNDKTLQMVITRKRENND